jgi:hypothetical protein
VLAQYVAARATWVSENPVLRKSVYVTLVHCG